ncbi:MAG: metal ABC transporter ATP-binding protein [Proteobacteria bacterium]|nr:metal ABC transporter ATP-binding protein [Pseudomonadota bacterium]
MDTIINLDNVSFSYAHIPVLRDITLAIGEGEFLGVIGPNAGGKSTLLKLILGLLQPDKGDIKVFGKSPDKGRSRIGYVPQYPAFSRDFPINVLDAVLLGRLGETRWYGGYTQKDKNIAMDSLKAVEIDNISNQTIDSLSGGQLQRVLIARALASRPDILILDEPTANIDVRAEEDIFALLKEYNEHMTIIVVSHDIGFISGYVDRVACLNQTLLCHTTSEISGKTIEDLYGAPVKMIQHEH